MGLFWLAVFPGLAWCVPGWLASRWALPSVRALERAATTLLFGASLVVPTAFVVPYVLRRPLGPGTVLLASLLWTTVFGVLYWRQRRLQGVSAAPPPDAAHGRWVVAATLGLAALNALTVIPRSFEAVEVFSPCPHQASMFLLEDGSGEGLVTWDPIWGRTVEHLTEHDKEPGYGIAKILTIQRIGSAATLVEHFAFHGSGGLVVASFTYVGIVALFSALLAATALRNRRPTPQRSDPWVVVGITAFTVLGYRLAGAYMVNENFLAASLATGMLWLVSRHRVMGGAPSGRVIALAAVVYAHAVGTRPELALVLPAALLLARPWTLRHFLVAGGLLLLFVSPWLLTNAENFGQALYHPSLSRGRVPLTLFGWHFHFHPLNWPFAPSLMRPPNDAFPNLIARPLSDMASFGVPYMALALVGALRDRRAGRSPTGLWVLWSLPIYLVLVAIVNLDRDKLSYSIMCFGPLPYWVASAVAGLPRRRDEWRRALLPAALVLTLALAPRALSGLELPVDTRPQFNESREARDFDPNDVKRERLLQPVWIPLPDPHDAEQALEWTLSLFWHGRPVHRRPFDVGESPVVSGPLHFWVEQRPYSRELRVQPMATPTLPPYLADPQDLELTKNYVSVSLQVPSQAPVTVRFSRDTELVVELFTDGAAPAGAAPGYLTLGLLDDGDQGIDEIRLVIDGVAVTPEILVVERAGRPLRPLLASNHPWHYEVLSASPGEGSPDDKLVLVPGAWPPSACPPPSDDPLVLGVEGLLDNRDPSRPVLIRRSAHFPPREALRCTTLRLVGQAH